MKITFLYLPEHLGYVLHYVLHIIHNSLKVLSKVFLLQSCKKYGGTHSSNLKFPLYYYNTAREKVIGEKPAKIILLEFTSSSITFWGNNCSL